MPSEVEKVLSGGGGCGALARATDWSQTSIGPVESWSQALRSTASLVLHNESGMLLWWGPDFIQLYNEAYRPMLGAKHPRAMGQPFSQCWKEVFHIVGPMAEVPYRGGPAAVSDDLALLIDRKLPLEEVHFRIAYSPVPDATVPGTGIGGVLATVTETTEQVFADRQLRTLRELSVRSAAAATGSAQEACAAAALTLAGDAMDVPFAMFYLHDEQRGLQLVAQTVAPAGHAGWPGNMVGQIRDVSVVPIARGVQVPASPWGYAPEAAIVLPLTSPDEPEPYGVLVCGISPHRVLDAGYRAFFDLAAGQVVTAIRNARALERERKRAEELAEFDRAKTLFFSNISHEFRTPLSLILGPLESAAAAPQPLLQGEDFQAALRNAKRLRKLVNQLLDFARIEAKRTEVHLQPTDLAAFTTDLASAFRSMIEHAGLRLDVDCPELSGPVLIDPEMWEKIVLNLLSNAFKHTFEGFIAVSLRERQEQVELRVSDSGIGIAPEHLPKLFDRFQRIEGVRARSHEGSGIGLALVADLVRLQGGCIFVDSEPGQGSSFCVRIPGVSAPAQAQVITATGQHKQAFLEEAQHWLGTTAARASPSAAQSDATILLADDNADMRAYLTRLLASHWHVKAVSDGREALEAARAEPPDLVLSDVMMPRLDGFGLLRELRADPALRTVPVILLSARAGEEAIGDGLRQGADDYITKPFSAAHLLVRIEAQLSASRVKLAAHEERRRLYTGLRNAPNPIALLTGPEHVISFVSLACLQVWGKDESIVGKPLLAALPELRDQPFIPLLDEVRRTGRRSQQSSMLARLDRAGDGKLVDVYFDFVYEPIFDAEGNVEAVFTLAVDVTGQVLAQRASAAALAEARRANKMKDEFLALLGHELRNPMAPIMTALELMKFRGDAATKREREVIERQANHLLRLVDDLLDVARITRGVVELKRRRASLQELITKSLETAGPLFAEKRHRLTVRVDSDLEVDVDPARMLQVLANLLTNAAKYTNPGGQVNVSAHAQGGEAVVAVSDDGIGIESETLPQVFEMFVQERQGLDRSRGGLGLGLAIVKALVQQHGGTVAARSEGRGRGSSFEVRLPLMAKSRDDVETSVGSEASGPAPVAAAAARVLVVDDNEDAAELLATAIEAMGHETRIAHDGETALEVAAAFQPQVAVLDIGLPIMDGYELARQLRSRGSLPRLIALTGYGQERDKQESSSAGFEQHIVKPVDLQRLSASIDQLLAR